MWARVPPHTRLRHSSNTGTERPPAFRSPILPFLIGSIRGTSWLGRSGRARPNRKGTSSGRANVGKPCGRFWSQARMATTSTDEGEVIVTRSLRAELRSPGRLEEQIRPDKLFPHEPQHQADVTPEPIWRCSISVPPASPRRTSGRLPRSDAGRRRALRDPSDDPRFQPRRCLARAVHASRADSPRIPVWSVRVR